VILQRTLVELTDLYEEGGQLTEAVRRTASEYALWEASRLLGGRRALVVTVWKP
jgi:hypothetical protein